MTQLEKSEAGVMTYLKLKKMPPKSNKKWLKAVVLVEKNDGSTNYAIAKCENEQISIVKDFGNICGIVQILETRPIVLASDDKSKK